MATFKAGAVTPGDFERTAYMASEKQVHQHDASMRERGSRTVLDAGYVLDPKDYPAKPIN